MRYDDCQHLFRPWQIGPEYLKLKMANIFKSLTAAANAKFVRDSALIPALASARGNAFQADGLITLQKGGEFDVKRVTPMQAGASADPLGFTDVQSHRKLKLPAVQAQVPRNLDDLLGVVSKWTPGTPAMVNPSQKNFVAVDVLISAPTDIAPYQILFANFTVSPTHPIVVTSTSKTPGLTAIVERVESLPNFQTAGQPRRIAYLWLVPRDKFWEFDKPGAFHHLGKVTTAKHYPICAEVVQYVVCVPDSDTPF